MDVKSGLPVISLYRPDQRAPRPDQLADLDALVFDIQDVGCRFYTYLATLKGSLEAAAKAGKPFIVLDRVNPVRGDLVEGPVVPAELTFTSCHPIALRHGMTMGELARMFNAELKLNADLRIIQIQGWSRDLWFDATGLPWMSPSPNMRNLNAATLYPGIGLLEFAISVGRGTDTPFEVIGAPFVQDEALAYELNKLGLSGVRFIPVRFRPTTSIYKGQECGGVRIIMTDRDGVRSVELGIAVAHTLHHLYGTQFDLKKFNSLLKDDETVNLISSGKPWKAILKSWKPMQAEFLKRRAAFLLYGPSLPPNVSPSTPE
jgi:uncharacterized protein YbbC (DUF1343 family)